MYLDIKSNLELEGLLKSSEHLYSGCNLTQGAQASLVPVEADGEGHYMSLINRPSSQSAKALTERLATEVHATLERQRGVTAKLKQAIGAIIADLMLAATDEGGGYAYRSTGSDAFTDLPVGKKAFLDAMSGLEALGYITRTKGYYTLGIITRDRASTFKPTQDFMDLAASSGVLSVDWSVHFEVTRRSKRLKNAVVLKSSSRRKFDNYGDKIPGTIMSLDRLHPIVIESCHMVDDINAYLLMQKLENCPLYAFRRIFNNGNVDGHGYSHGGRIYGLGRSYQNMKKEERRQIRINGEPAVELDIKCCQPTILAARMGEPLEPGFFPYDGTEFDRDIIKMFITQTLGGTGKANRWSSNSNEKWAKINAKRGRATYPRLQRAAPFGKVRTAAIKRWPLIGKWKDIHYQWYDLQFIESEVVLKATHFLATKRDICALPLHDALLVPASKADEAERVLSRCFVEVVGVEPTISRA